MIGDPKKSATSFHELLQAIDDTEKALVKAKKDKNVENIEICKEDLAAFKTTQLSW